MLEPFETSKPGSVTNLLQPPPFSKPYFLVLPKQFHRETHIQHVSVGGYSHHLPYWLNTGSPQDHGNAGLDSVPMGREYGQGVST